MPADGAAAGKGGADAGGPAVPDASAGGGLDMAAAGGAPGGEGGAETPPDAAAADAALTSDGGGNALPILLVIANDPNPSPTTGMMAALSGAGLKFEVQNSSTTPLVPASAAGKSLATMNNWNTPRGTCWPRSRTFPSR